MSPYAAFATGFFLALILPMLVGTVRAWIFNRRVLRGLHSLGGLVPNHNAFTCPKCGGHAFGASGLGHGLPVNGVFPDAPDTATVTCHQNTLDGTGGCGFSGPYKKHIKSPSGVFPASTAYASVTALTAYKADQEAFLIEVLERERDQRWVRCERLSHLQHDATGVAATALGRANTATTIQELAAADAAAEALSETISNALAAREKIA